MSARNQILALQQGMTRSIIGQEQVIERLLLTLLADGNLLLEGLPGLAKTRAIKSLARHLEEVMRLVRGEASQQPGAAPAEALHRVRREHKQREAPAGNVRLPALNPP